MIAFDHDVAGMRLNVEAICTLRLAIVPKSIAAECIAMSAVSERLLAKIDARGAVSRNCIVNKKIAGIFMANGDAVLSIIFDSVATEFSVAHSPAKEEADLSVVVKAAPFYYWLIAARARVDPIPGVAIGLAILHTDVVRNLE